MKDSSTSSVGIVSTGMYLPEPVLTAAEIAKESGLPEWVVRDKLGIEQKHMAAPDDHPNEMAIKAAKAFHSQIDHFRSRLFLRRSYLPMTIRFGMEISF